MIVMASQRPQARVRNVIDVKYQGIKGVLLSLYYVKREMLSFISCETSSQTCVCLEQEKLEHDGSAMRRLHMS